MEAPLGKAQTAMAAIDLIGDQACLVREHEITKASGLRLVVQCGGAYDLAVPVDTLGVDEYGFLGRLPNGAPIGRVQRRADQAQGQGDGGHGIGIHGCCSFRARSIQARYCQTVTLALFACHRSR